MAKAPAPSLEPSPLPQPPPVRAPKAPNLNDPGGAGLGPISSLANPAPLPPGGGTSPSGVGGVQDLLQQQGLGPGTLGPKSKSVRRPGLSRVTSTKSSSNPRRPGKRTLGNS